MRCRLFDTIYVDCACGGLTTQSHFRSAMSRLPNRYIEQSRDSQTVMQHNAAPVKRLCRAVSRFSNRLQVAPINCYLPQCRVCRETTQRPSETIRQFVAFVHFDRLRDWSDSIKHFTVSRMFCGSSCLVVFDVRMIKL